MASTSDSLSPLEAIEPTGNGPLVLVRLSIMMFLQYAVWGAWLPLCARFLSASVDEGGLGFDSGQIGWILGAAGAVGAVTAPFVAGQFADRYFRTERFLAVLLIIGGCIKWYTSYQTAFWPWFWLSIAYSIVYMPTLALSNSLAFAHIRDADQDFPKVRVWGTIGWIAASWLFPMVWLQTNLAWQAEPPFISGPEVENVTARLVDALKFSGLISFVYALYCLTLPATPPKREGVEPLAFAKAFRLFREPSFAVLVVTSLAIATIHQIYFLQTGPFFSSLGLRDADIGPAMTIGQFSEIMVMAVLGLMLKRLGFKTVMLTGAAAYVLRYAIWGTTALPPSLMVASQVLHGVCYACFFAASFIYVDRICDVDVRHSAQTVYGIMILGGGPVLGGWLSGAIARWTGEAGGQVGYSAFWYVVSGIALVTTLVFALFFRDETTAWAAEVGTDPCVREGDGECPAASVEHPGEHGPPRTRG